MIHSLLLENFKQHNLLELNFERGLNAIQGDNGAGKSNILRAVMFALFGVSAAGVKENLTTWGATGLSVTLDTTLGGKRLKIVRTLNKAEVWEGGVIQASGQTPATKYVETLLGMDHKMFKAMLFAAQGKTQLLLEMGATGLQKHMEQVANVDALDKVLAMIASDDQLANGELRGIGQLRDVNELREHLSIAQNLLDARVATQTEANIYLQFVATPKEEEAKVAFETAFTNQNKCREAREILTVAETRYKVAREQLETHQVDTPTPVSAELIEQHITQLSNLAMELKDGQDALNTYKVNKGSYDVAVKSKQQFESLVPIAEEAMRLDADKKAKTGIYTAAFEAHKAAHTALKDAVCPTCKRAFDHTHMFDLTTAADKTTETLEACTKELVAAELALSTYLKEHNVEMSFLVTVESRIKEFCLKEPSLPSVTQEGLEKLAQTVEQCRTDLNNLRAGERIFNQWVNEDTKLTQARNEALTNVKSAEKRLEELGPVEEVDITALKAAADEALKAKELAVQAAKLAEYQALQQQEVVNALVRDVELEESKADRINAIEKAMSLRFELQKYLRKNRAAFMDDSWTSLTHYASYLISSITEGFMHGLERSAAGEFNLIEGSRLVPVEELSGARKSIVGLSLRLALAKLFYGNNGFILLDEVTADCTEANSARVAGMLRGLDTQVIMVTHRHNDAANAVNTIVLG